MKILKPKGNYWSWLRLKISRLGRQLRLQTQKIPEDFRVQYESLLDDKSYQTGDCFFYLWNNFPEQRLVYLEKSKDWIGFSDYNLKTLWLSLAVSTPEYKVDKTVL
jgi:aminopeptidase N